MTLKFFADQCVPKLITQGIQKAGYNVFILRDYLPTNAIDQDVIQKAQELGAILLSLNGDFADIVTYPPVKYLGIICLQVKNHPETVPQLIANLVTYMKHNPGADHYKGKLFVVDVARVRVRQ